MFAQTTCSPFGHEAHQRELMLFHISEAAGIARFDPRPSEYASDPVVWAIDERRLCNYLAPRDCARVTFYAGPNTSADDAARFLGSSPAVVAIESAWLERLRSCRLYGYRMPADTFECLDAGAGYFVSRVPVVASGAGEEHGDGESAPRHDPGYTPLMSAAACGQLATVKCLLSAGADPFKTDYHRGTALHSAATNGSVADRQRAACGRLRPGC